jgi:hypothetical protein
MSNDNADDYLGDIADDFLTSADGERLTGDIDTNIEEYCKTPWRTTELLSTSGHNTVKC